MATRNGRTRSERHQRRKGGRWRIVLATILLIIGGALLALNPIKRMLIEQGTEASGVAHLTAEQIKENKKKNVTYNFDDIEQLDAASVVRDKLLGNAEASELPTIGAIAIPELGMNLPIHMGVSNVGMYLGAGTLDPNQEMGKSNYPLASHHSIDQNLLFAPLMKAKYGQKIYLTDLEKVYEYTIDYIEQVPAEAVYLLDPTEEAVVTLITCDYGLVDRVVVRGTLSDEMKIQDADPAVLKTFEIDQTIAG
ncbi:sortase A [Ignavigranum ruoffiae]|uniref:Sortase A n=1 Tax=Ignavigranum ruoffiae TaxID=89093 RepID=A0A1H9F6Z3_9LACT|nr:class A sortase [Ignavigranum ruoffiae]SEQ33701.1 sortase A [Ignavigranum ruoffiae]